MFYKNELHCQWADTPSRIEKIRNKKRIEEKGVIVTIVSNQV